MSWLNTPPYCLGLGVEIPLKQIKPNKFKPSSFSTTYVSIQETEFTESENSAQKGHHQSWPVARIGGSDPAEGQRSSAAKETVSLATGTSRRSSVGNEGPTDIWHNQWNHPKSLNCYEARSSGNLTNVIHGRPNYSF